MNPLIQEQILFEFHASMEKLIREEELTEENIKIIHFVLLNVHEKRKVGIPDNWLKESLNVHDKVYALMLFIIEEAIEDGFIK